MEELSMEDNLGLSHSWVIQFDFGETDEQLEKIKGRLLKVFWTGWRT